MIDIEYAIARILAMTAFVLLLVAIATARLWWDDPEDWFPL